MLSLQYKRENGDELSNRNIITELISCIEEDNYDDIKIINPEGDRISKRFKITDDSIKYTLKGTESEAKKIIKNATDSLASRNAKFNIRFQCITIDNEQVCTIAIRKDSSEALKFAPADNGAIAASLKLPKDKMSEFLSDVASKFNLKKFKKYGTEFWSQSSGEVNSKYYITKTISNNLHAFVNTKFDAAFHKDIEAFKEYLEEKIKSYAPAPVEEKEVVEIDQLATPFSIMAQDQMTIPMFKNESKFLREDAVVNLAEMKEVFGGNKVYDILLEAVNGGSRINTLKSSNGLTYRTKIVNEDKFILEENDFQPEEIINNGVEGLDDIVKDEIKPGDEVITKDFHVMYYIRLANGAGVLVSPSLNAVKIMMNGMGEPDQDDEEEEIVECKWADIHGLKRSLLEEKDGLDDLMKGKGWDKELDIEEKSNFGGKMFKWDKFSTTTEEYLIAINDKEKLYKFIYDPIVTNDDKQVKISKQFSFEGYDDIILPSTMDEFDHVMSLKSDDLYKKGTKVEYKGKEAKIKKYNFGKYVIKMDGKEQEVEAKDLKPVTESKSLSKGNTVEDKKGQKGEVVSFDPNEKQGPNIFPGGAVKVKYRKAYGEKDGIYVEPANDLKLVTEYKQYVLKESSSAHGFAEKRINQHKHTKTSESTSPIDTFIGRLKKEGFMDVKEDDGVITFENEEGSTFELTVDEDGTIISGECESLNVNVNPVDFLEIHMEEGKHNVKDFPFEALLDW